MKEFKIDSREKFKRRCSKERTSAYNDVCTKSKAMSIVGTTKIIHMEGIRPFQAQSLPNQNRILRERKKVMARYEKEK